MRIGVAGPISLPALGDYLPQEAAGISTYSFPYIGQLVRGYLDAGHEVDVFALSEDSTVPSLYENGALRIFVGRRRKSPRQRGLDFFRQERLDLVRAMSAAKPDVIHAHWIYEFASAALAVQRDALVTAHDSPLALLRHYHHPYWWLRAALGVRTLRAVQNLSVVSPSLIDEMKWQIRSSRVDIIPNGVVVPDSSSAKSITSGRVVYGTVANGFDGRKNTKVALEAFGLLRSTGADARMVMIGTDHGRGEAAHEWASREGLTEGVEFIGQIPNSDLKKILASDISVLVHTSRWEACSMAILEAQSLGIPVIGGARSGGVPFTVGPQEDECIVNVSSPHEVARAMREVVQDPEEYQDRSRRVRQRVISNFQFDDVIECYVGRLQSIIAGRREEASTTGGE